MTTATDRYAEELLHALAEGVAERVGHLDVAAAGPANQVAQAMLALLPAAPPHPWAAQIGPCYDTRGVTSLMGVSRQAIGDRVARRTMLAARTTSGRLRYPTFQFVGREIAPPVRTVLEAFREAPVDGWAVAAWFTTPARDLGGATPARWLLDGHDPGPALALARETAARWSAR